MSHLFGSTRQIAFVVKDIDAAMAHWACALGVGPFFVRRGLVPDIFAYRGNASPAPRLSIALGNSGGLQVELIQQHDQHPSAWRDGLLRAPDGLHHVSSWLTRQEFDATRTRMMASGATVVHEGFMASSDVRFVYFSVGAGAGGLLVEIADVMQTAYPRMQMIAKAAKGWDGRDPIREVPIPGA